MFKIDNNLLLDTIQEREPPEIYLCNRNLNKLEMIQSVSDFNITFHVNAFDEISFAVNMINEKKWVWDRIVDLSIIMVPQMGYFEINVNTKTSESGESKSISGKSLEIELDHVKLFGFEINNDDIQDEDYSVIKFYDPLNTKSSLLHRILAYSPSWTVLHVDDKLWDKQRTFGVDDVSIYGFLTGDVSREFECFFQFDTFNRTISCFLWDEYGKDLNVYLDCENYLNEITLEAPADQIFNWFKVKGGDDVIDVREVNPDGSDYVVRFGENDLSDMSEELQNRLKDYETVFEAYQDEFLGIMARMQSQTEVIWDLYHSYSEDDKDNTKQGLNYLAETEKLLKSLEDQYLSSGYGNSTSSNYSIYNDNHLKLLATQIAIASKKNEISIQENIYNAIKTERDLIQSVLDIRNFLGGDLWLELSNYRRESTYTNEFFKVTDSMTDIERFKIEKELLERANKDLGKACNPQPILKSSVSNLLTKPEFKNLVSDDFRLGNYIFIGINDKYVAKVRIVTMSFDFQDISKVDLEFSDLIINNKNYNDPHTIIEQAKSTAKGYDIINKQMSNASDNLSFIMDLRHNGLDAAHTQITASKNQGITIDKHGILCREYNEEKLDWEDEQLKIINSLICFTNDKWASVQMALGRAKINNQIVYGLLCDALVGKWIFTETAYIGNENNTMTFDKDGFISYSKDFKTVIKINPNNNDGLFEIWMNYEESNAYRTLWTDNAGNLNITGKFEADKVHTGYIRVSNDINSIIIDPNNPTGLFEIYNRGNLRLWVNENGDLSIKDSIFECGEINSADGYFRIDKTGHAVFTSAEIGGFTLKNDILYAGKGNTWIRISPATKISGEQYSSISLGESDSVNPNTGKKDAVVHLRSDGYCRFGLAGEGDVRVNHEAESPYADLATKVFYSLFTKNFKIERDSGRVSANNLYLKHGTGIRSYTDGNENSCNLIRLTNEEDANDKITIGQKANAYDVNVLAGKIILNGSEGVEIKTQATINGVKIVTKTDLDRLTTEYDTSIKQWETAYNNMKSNYDNMKSSRDYYMNLWNSHHCPVCTRTHAD